MADEQPGWQIRGRFYPHNGADALRHGDFALMREVSGLALDELDRGDDPIAVDTAWMAVAIWQANPEMRRDQVRVFVETLGAGEAERIGWGIEDDAAPLTQDESPPSGNSSSDSASPQADASSLSASPSTTKSPEEQTQEPSSPGGSGVPPSDTGADSSPVISVPLTAVGD